MRASTRDITALVVGIASLLVGVHWAVVLVALVVALRLSNGALAEEIA